MDDIHQEARTYIQIASNRMKDDIRVSEGLYNDRDTTLTTPQRKRGLSPKFQNAWKAPQSNEKDK